MHIHFKITLFIIVLLYGCGPDLIKVEEYSGEKLSKTFTINKDSLLQGRYLSYFDDGSTIFEESYYENGKLEGTRTIYYLNGQAEIQETYENDLLTDTLYVYFESGIVKQKVPYQMGVLTGEVTSYYTNGKIKEKVMFAENIEQGLFEEFFKNGQPKWRGQYLNGANEFGELLKFDSSGTLIKRLMCDSIARCKTVWTIEAIE